MTRTSLVGWGCLVALVGCDVDTGGPRSVGPAALEPDPPPTLGPPRIDQPEPQGLPDPSIDASAYQDLVTAIYLVPAGQAAVTDQREFFARAMDRIAEWYRAATGGSTFDHQVLVIQATHPIDWFDGHLGLQAAFGKVDAQLRELGLPLYAERTNFLVALQGQDVHYGGAMAQTQGGLELVGADSFRAVIDAGCEPGECGLGGLDGDGVTGGIAHELGHGLGLPHTEGSPEEKRWALMAEHWHFPNNGFVGDELVTVRKHPLIGGGSGPACGDGVCEGGESCDVCPHDCECEDACEFMCSDYGFADGQCHQGWACTWPCLAREDCGAAEPAESCTFACSEYGYADGQCVEGWLCAWPCILQDAC